MAAPSLLSGGTDSNHDKEIADETYRFSPKTLPPADIGGAHSSNEGIRVGNRDDRVRLYIRLRENATRE
jgi:acetylornithine deacetylase/succinyl-diaminopimelate desuccinylase-like protein